MKILLANTLHPAFGGGGVETYLGAAVEQLSSKHELAMLCEGRVPGAQSIPTWRVGDLGEEETLRQVAEWDPEVVFQHGVRSTTLEAALTARWPAVLFAHSYYGTCPTGTKRYAAPQFQACERRIGPGCLAIHYVRRCGGLSPATMIADYRRQTQRSRLLPRYRAVVVGSRHMEREFKRHLQAESAVHTIPLPPTGIRPTPDPPTPRDRTGTVVMAARLTKLKGGHHLIDALATAQKGLGMRLSATILGTGPEEEALRRQAETRGIHADFRGWVPRAIRNDVFERADVVAVPSLWPEPFGLVGIEAGCVGTPAVAYALGGIPEWLQSGVNGELASGTPPSPRGLAQALVRCLENPDYHQRLRQGAWKAAQAFPLESHFDALERVLDEAASGRRR
jgi:glycosyltransferase involved in cell wall biosynthesis